MSIRDEIERCGHAMTDPYQDGFYQFYHKQKILAAMWECERWLKRSDTYIGEKEWIEKNKPEELND